MYSGSRSFTYWGFMLSFLDSKTINYNWFPYKDRWHFCVSFVFILYTIISQTKITLIILARYNFKIGLSWYTRIIHNWDLKIMSCLLHPREKKIKNLYLDYTEKGVISLGEAVSLNLIFFYSFTYILKFPHFFLFNINIQINWPSM